jgi:serine/threonine-protein phosphatase 4 regulatory subunit 2
MWFVVKVLSEYSEAKMTDEQQKEALGEPYSELVSRLDEGLYLLTC